MRTKLSGRRTSPLALLGVLFAATACASAGSSDGPWPAGDVVVEVDNTQPSYRDLTIFIQAEQGTRWRLGSIDLNQRKVFTFDMPGSRGRFRLVAESPLARDRMSDFFSLTPGSEVEWDVDLNRLWITEPDPGG